MPTALRFVSNTLRLAASVIVATVFVLGFISAFILLVKLFPMVMLVILSVICSPLGLLGLALARS